MMKRIIMILACTGLLMPSVGFAQKVITEQGMAVIDCSDMPAGAAETRTPDFAPGGRVVRHTWRGNDINSKVSKKFAVGKTDLTVDGKNTAAMSWAEAAGWFPGTAEDPTGANYVTTAVPTADTGCSQYQGYNGTDAKGTWRLPTQRELTLMWVLKSALETKVAPFCAIAYNYWSSTEDSATFSWYNDLMIGIVGGFLKYSTYPIRCVRDL